MSVETEEDYAKRDFCERVFSDIDRRGRLVLCVIRTEKGFELVDYNSTTGHMDNIFKTKNLKMYELTDPENSCVMRAVCHVGLNE